MLNCSENFQVITDEMYVLSYVFLYTYVHKLLCSWLSRLRRTQCIILLAIILCAHFTKDSQMEPVCTFLDVNIALVRGDEGKMRETQITSLLFHHTISRIFFTQDIQRKCVDCVQSCVCAGKVRSAKSSFDLSIVNIFMNWHVTRRIVYHP